MVCLYFASRNALQTHARSDFLATGEWADFLPMPVLIRLLPSSSTLNPHSAEQTNSERAGSYGSALSFGSHKQQRMKTQHESLYMGFKGTHHLYCWRELYTSSWHPSTFTEEQRGHS